MFFRRKKKSNAERDALVAESQQLLIDAAVETSMVAQDVTRTMQRRMEDAVRQFIATARIMNDALLICAVDGSITAFNPAAQKMFDLPDEPNCTIDTLFRKRDGTIVSVDELWKIGKGRSRALKGITISGDTIATQVRVAVLDRADGETIVILIAQDVSMLEKALGPSVHGYAIIMQNEIIATNTTLSRLYGYGPDELLGRGPDAVMKSKDRSGKHLDIVFEIANIQWDGDGAILIITRQAK